MALAAQLKDEGNELFRQGNYLKAAAIYTKAIKEEPQNAVLYRCGAAKSCGHLECAKTLEVASAPRMEPAGMPQQQRGPSTDAGCPLVACMLLQQPCSSPAQAEQAAQGVG
jgi:hypothetical protein